MITKHFFFTQVQHHAQQLRVYSFCSWKNWMAFPNLQSECKRSSWFTLCFI